MRLTWSTARKAGLPCRAGYVTVAASNSTRHRHRYVGGGVTAASSGSRGTAASRDRGTGVSGRRTPRAHCPFRRPAGAHDDDTVGVLRHDTHVVSDEQDAHAGSVRRRSSSARIFGLDRDVEGCGGLVGDEQIGFARQGERDRDPLLLPPGELVRVVVHASLGVGDLHLPEQVHAAARAPALDVFRCARIASRSCQPTRRTGSARSAAPESATPCCRARGRSRRRGHRSFQRRRGRSTPGESRRRAGDRGSRGRSWTCRSRIRRPGPRSRRGRRRGRRKRRRVVPPRRRSSGRGCRVVEWSRESLEWWFTAGRDRAARACEIRSSPSTRTTTTARGPTTKNGEWYAFCVPPDEGTERRGRRSDAEAEEAHGSSMNTPTEHRQREWHCQWFEAVGQDVSAQDPSLLGSERSRGFDVGRLPYREHRRPGQPTEHRDLREHDQPSRCVKTPGPMTIVSAIARTMVGNARIKSNARLDNGVDPAVPGSRRGRAANRSRSGRHRQEDHYEIDPDAVEGPGQDVATDGIGAEEMLTARVRAAPRRRSVRRVRTAPSQGAARPASATMVTRTTPADP